MEQVSLQFVRKAGCLLWVPGSFISASDEDIALNCNGCGTKGLGGYLVPDNMWGLNVTIVCNVHDWMYGLCESEDEEDLADYYFKCNLRRYIREKSVNAVIRSMRLTMANTYFAAVSLTYCSPKLQEAVKRK